MGGLEVDVAGRAQLDFTIFQADVGATAVQHQFLRRADLHTTLLTFNLDIGLGKGVENAALGM
ncbi:hypothetical protein D3C76_1233190 [compost metagenome]